ncbi:MAG: hypothetical protein HN948_03695 [Clostridia bacterium]|jgi:hypothetical protein|nr:hypothetical protein [Clostridia bacterium]MBT7122097.1 hypothetical protein [Clostridia bacterium]
MKISIEKNVVNLVPESTHEKAELEALWRLMIDCNDQSRKMVPIGEFVPAKNNSGASFHIEGLPQTKQEYTAIAVDEDSRCYCATCNNFVDVKKGSPIPLCCGKLMEVID